MKILSLSGSMRSASTNSTLLHAIATSAHDLADFDIYQGLGDLPIFSPDLDGDNMPQSVKDLIAEVVEADGVIIACPEYAHGIPGGLKNALDWIVSNEAFPGKPVLMVHASTRGQFLRDALSEVLRTMSANLISQDGLTIDLMGKTLEQAREQLLSFSRIEEMRAAVTFFIDEIERLGKT